jgi:polyhydroxybutyrate depolymerase
MQLTTHLLQKILILLLICVLTFPAISQDINGSMNYGGKTRTYLLHVPTGYNGSTPMPLVLAFHGLSLTGSKMASITGFSPIADQEDFIVVYPDGLNKKWTSPGGSLDDVGFISALIDKLENDYNIDANRIYAAGASNGGMFTYRLALELTDRFAAVAVVAGYMPGYAPGSTPVPSHALPVLHFHGTADPVIPYNEAESAVDYWKGIDACASSPVTTQLPNNDAGDGTTVDELAYKMVLRILK